MSHQAQTWVDKVGIHQCKNGGELLVLIRVANHTNGDMRGCYASGETLASECLMGESTVLKHLRRLKAGQVLLPGDPKLLSHIRADRRPPVYDLAGGHEPGCPGKHSSDLVCQVTATGAQSEHPPKSPPATGARSEHPKNKRRSAGARSEHPLKETPATGVQIDLSRVFKSSTNSYKEAKLPLSSPAGALNHLPSQQPQDRERDAAAPGGLVPEPRGHGEVQERREVRPGLRIAEGWAAQRAALGLVTSPARVTSFAKEADWLLASGIEAVRLERAAALMASEPSWFSLTKQMEAAPAPAPVGADGPGGGRRGGELSPEVRAAMAARAARASGL